ncbi:MBL fold metallo-hydrolase [Arthrobacter sp. FW306-2-2C-D06B]|uniref:MBL fold metallo-hydrolase n=1 Tax=Arthrobacter sp. FW306-2-2C-D06B TaxID=2879618 RepID=UPI001F471F67|nr:MBL fold metallo-hydrolase [Arthrobacter sp. FW306-2-2C-D06B]UKA60463.1 MBL fold metallo-hydrolase [Arthrobacter sp. FW306-2-2C-D06B]
MRYTLSYLLVGGSDVVIVDPGWDSDEGWWHLQDGLREAGFLVSDVNGIVATHYHSDHLGMATRLRNASGAWVAMGENEVCRPFTEGDKASQLMADRAQFALWGVPTDDLDEIAMNKERLSFMSKLANPDVRLVDGGFVPAAGLSLRVVATPGHSPGHICLIDEIRGLIFSGDHVLPRISPHIPYEVPGPVNPLGDYYDSLNLIGFEDEMEVCPAHEYRFIGMQTRVNQLVAHNNDRSREVLQVLAEHNPQTIWSIAQSLTWSRGWSSLRGISLRLAISETASHLAHLQAQGRDIKVSVREIVETPGFAS